MEHGFDISDGNGAPNKTFKGNDALQDASSDRGACQDFTHINNTSYSCPQDINCNDCHTNDRNSIVSDPLFCECESIFHKDCSFPFCACREHDFDSANETSEGILFNQQKCACDAEHVKCQNPRCSCEDHLLDNEDNEKALQPLSLSVSEVNKNAKCVCGAGAKCKSCQDPLFKNMILFFKLDSAKQTALDKLNLSCTYH